MEYTPTGAAPIGPSETLVSALGRHSKLLIAAVVLAAAFAYFGFAAFTDATGYYVTVDEAVAMGDQLFGETFQLKGRLTADSFVREEGSTTAHFTLEENGAQIPATYEGALPDLFFNEHSEIVLAGQFGPSGLFEADRVLIKCPSKYQSSEEAPARYTQ